METPIDSVSVLVSSYNTNNKYIYECITSILSQKGNFSIELIWLNDGSDEEHSTYLESMLNIAKSKSTFPLKVIYKKYDKNMGISYCLHEGVLLSTNELIIKMDSDDIMVENRIQSQINFMKENPECMLCGTNMTTFSDLNNDQIIILESSNHPFITTWEEYKKTKSSWILNHPTACFRKTAILEVGNYDKDMKYPFEDLDLELRILKKYGFICNISEILLYYRIHSNQITHLNQNNYDITLKRTQMIENITST